MEYRVIRTGQSDDHFEHALFGGGRQKGAQNKNHKYLARAWWQNKWRYAYTQAEVRMLQNLGKNQSLSEKQKIKKLERESAAAKKTTDKIEKQAKRSVTRAVDDARSEVASRANTARVTASRAVDSARNAVSNTARKVSRSAREAVDDVQSGVAAKQVAIKAETARNDARNLVDRASNAARETSRKVSEGARSTAEKARSTASSVADKAKSTVDKVRDTATKARDSVRDFTNYADDVDDRKKGAQNAMRVINEQTHINEKRAKKASEYSDGWAQRGNKEQAIKNQNKADTYSRKATESAEAFDRAKERYDKADKESKSTKYKMSDLLRNGANSQVAQEGKKKVEQLLNKAGKTGKNLANTALSSARSAIDSGRNKVTDLLNKASNTAKDVAEKVANTEVGQKVSDAAERVADKVTDAKESAQHKIYANEMKRKYGADSLHYKDAQALLDHDKAVDDLAKAREKYGINSSEYKAAMRKEQSTRDAMDEVHEQNLYANNAQYKKISDQASALGSYIDNMDARGGPQTAEGKANYRKAVQDLERLEAQLERMWNEDWE